MKKTFCDCCGDEITSSNDIKSRVPGERYGAEITKRGHKLRVEVIAGVDGVMNGGDVCRYCVIDAVKSLDDRPQQYCVPESDLNLCVDAMREFVERVEAGEVRSVKTYTKFRGILVRLGKSP